jgi:deoxycitidine kinase/deoxyguanosine kinase
MMHLSLEGNIGAGKTCLLSQLEAMSQEPQHAAKLDSLLILQEPVDEWKAPQPMLGGMSMLQAFYANPLRHSFAFQMFVLRTRIRQAVAARSSGRGVLVTERCMETDRELFTLPLISSGVLSHEEMLAYDTWLEFAREDGHLNACPDVVVYLRCSPEVCMQRVLRRRRAGEEGITLQYLHGLHNAHEAWVARLIQEGRRVVVLDGHLEGAAALAEHADAVLRVLADERQHHAWHAEDGSRYIGKRRKDALEVSGAPSLAPVRVRVRAT